jgi:hypothetical protein
MNNENQPARKKIRLALISSLKGEKVEPMAPPVRKFPA